MSLIKLKFLGQRNHGQGGFVDEKHKHMLWGKGEVKEVTMQHAGVLMSEYPDLFVECKDAAVGPEPKAEVKEKMGLAVEKNKQASAPQAEKAH